MRWGWSGGEHACWITLYVTASWCNCNAYHIIYINDYHNTVNNSGVHVGVTSRVVYLYNNTRTTHTTIIIKPRSVSSVEFVVVVVVILSWNPRRVVSSIQTRSRKHATAAAVPHGCFLAGEIFFYFVKKWKPYHIFGAKNY